MSRCNARVHGPAAPVPLSGSTGCGLLLMRRAEGRLTARAAVAAFALVALTACEQNTYSPPPPPKVDVALPVQRQVTRYLEVTGNTAPVKSVDLVARVQGF